MPAVVLTTLAALATLAVVPSTRPAGADPVAGLQAQAGAIAQKLVLEQLQVDAFQQQSSVAAARVAADGRAIAQLDGEITTDQQAIDQRLTLVRRQAIMSYVNSGADSSAADTALFTGGAGRAQTVAEYTNLAVGNITTALAQLHAAQHALEAEQTALQQRLAQDRTDQASRSSALTQAQAAAQQLQAQQAQVTGQLAAAVANAQAAQARAAAAAVAQAQAQAQAQRAPPRPPAPVPSSPGAAPTGGTQTQTPSPPPVPGGSGLVDPPLNAFLQCVVQAESGGNYGAVSPDGLYMGAFQFSQPTWNTAAQAAGLASLVGVPPNRASKPAQDTVAVTLYNLDGQQPWLGDRCVG